MQDNNNISEREQIAERLKEARTQAGLSQDNAAKILGLQRPAISEIESGKRKVSAEEIIHFGKIYKVSVSWLLLKDDAEKYNDEQLKVAARELGKMSEADRKKLLDILNILPNR
jgi:transcriptional regulator with XRE-family HTH domain